VVLTGSHAMARAPLFIKPELRSEKINLRNADF